MTERTVMPAGQPTRSLLRLPALLRRGAAAVAGLLVTADAADDAQEFWHLRGG